MTTSFQISDKRGDAILVVRVENEYAEAAEEEFAKAVGLAGLGSAYESFGISNPVAAVPAASFVTRAPADPWGQPPVAPLQQAPQRPAAAVAAPAGAPGPAPVCQHGTKLYRTGTSAANGRAWSAWFCPAPGNDATQCAKDWIR